MEQKKNFPPWPERESVRDATHFVVVTNKDSTDFTIVPTEPKLKKVYTPEEVSILGYDPGESR
jgi:hypothetical protein